MIDETLFKGYAENTLQIRKIVSRRNSGEFNMPQFLTLHMIVKSNRPDGEFNVTDITNNADMAMPNVVRMLNEMQMGGYIKRRRDGRNVYISITEEGKKYHDWCLEITNKRLKDLIEELKAADVSDDEINAYLDTANKLQKIYLKHYNKNRQDF